MPQTANLDAIYQKIGKRLVSLMRQKSLPLNYAVKGAKRSKMPNCTPGKSWSCGYTCLPMSKKRCGSPLPGQPATYAAYLAAQAGANAAPAATPKQATPKPATPPPPPAAAGGQAIANIDDLLEDSPVTTNQAELNKARAGLEKRFGKATVEAAEANVKKIMDDPDTGVYIRVGSASTLELILGDRFKTAHELGSTAQVPSMKGSYLDNRARVEEKTMGVGKNTDPADRPIYGYIAGKDLDGASHADVTQAYGSIAVKLKSDVKDRTTFTGADSFKSGIASEMTGGATPPPPNAASIAALTRHGYDNGKLPGHLDHLDSSAINGSQLKQAAKAKGIDDLATVGAPTGNRYIEAQVHGKVTPKDIAEINFTPRGQGDRPTAAIAQFAKDNNVPLLVNGKRLSADDLDNIITPPADARSKALKDLSGALDRGDFDAVQTHALAIAKTADSIKLSPGERDGDLKALLAESGYDRLPKVGTSADLDKIHADGGLLMARGVSPDPQDKLRYLRQFQSGDFHVGNGIYGNGTYVGHSGHLDPKGRFVHQNPATAAKDAKRAVDGVAKHNYISATTVNFRMAADSSFNVVTQSDLLKERNRTKAAFDNWAATERQKLMAGAKQFTRSDASAYNRKTAALKARYDPTKATVTVTSKSSINGGTTKIETQEWEYPGVNGKPLKLFVTKVDRPSILGGKNSITYELRDPKTKKVIATVDQSSGKPSPATIKKMLNEASDHSVFSSMGFDRPPKVGDISDPAASKRVADFDDKARRIERVIGIDDNGESRLAVIKGYDAVALDESYEPKTFMNLLNRSKITVQDDPLDWKRAKKVGAA